LCVRRRCTDRMAPQRARHPRTVRIRRP
jgi:hypothetical protein